MFFGLITLVDDPSVEECLKEIFESPDDLFSPPCILRRTSNEKECPWSPVNAKMTPILDNVGMGVDSDALPSPVA